MISSVATVAIRLTVLVIVTIKSAKNASRRVRADLTRFVEDLILTTPKRQ